MTFFVRQSFLSKRLLPRTFLFPYVSLKVFPEILDRALDRFDSAGCQCTVRIAGSEQCAVALEILDIAGLAGAFFDGAQYFFEPRKAIAAGRAPAAGLSGKELGQIMHEPDRACFVVENDHRSGAQTAAGLHYRIEIHPDIEMVRDKKIR